MATVTWCGMRELPNVVQTILPAASGGISKLTIQEKEFVFFSDNCSGQNKNRPGSRHVYACSGNIECWSNFSLFSGTRSYWKRRGFHAFHNEKSRQTGKYLHTNCSGTQLLRQPKDRGIPDSEELTEKGQFYHFLLSLTFTINTAFVRL